MNVRIPAAIDLSRKMSSDSSNAKHSAIGVQLHLIKFVFMRIMSLLVCCFTSVSRKVCSYGDVTVKFTAFEQGGIFIVPHLLCFCSLICRTIQILKPFTTCKGYGSAPITQIPTQKNNFSSQYVQYMYMYLKWFELEFRKRTTSFC